MLRLYTPSPALGDASSALLSDITRRQRVRQLTHEILQACTAASSPFVWLRIEGFDRLAAALEAGVVGDAAALANSLDQTYSQVLEVVLSTLDRQLIVPPEQQQQHPRDQQQAAAAGSDTVRSAAPLRGTAAAGTSGQQQQLQQQLPPGGLAPGQAIPEEWAAAMRVLQGVCILHPKTRAVLGSAQYLQLLVTRACCCPPAAPAGLDALLAVVSTSAEAQALFVGNGGLDAVVRLARGRPAQPGPRSGGGGGVVGTPAVPRAARLRCLGFVHALVGHVLPRGVRAGLVHPNTLRSSQQLLHAELGPAAAEALCRSSEEAMVQSTAAARARSCSQLAEGATSGSSGAAATGAAVAPGAGAGGTAAAGGGRDVDSVAEAAYAAMVVAGRAAAEPPE